jgi:hypothetical protein
VLPCSLRPGFPALVGAALSIARGPLAGLLACLFLLGISARIVQVASTLAGTHGPVAARAEGSASAVLTASRQVGSALGVAIVSATLVTAHGTDSPHRCSHARRIRMGRLDEAIEELTPLPDTRAVPAPDEPWHQWLVFGHRAAALVYAGRLGEADELLTMAYREVMDHPAAEARAFVAVWFAFLHLEQGRPASAFRRASESYTLFQQLGRPSLTQRGYVVPAQALALTGRAEQAVMTLSALDALTVPIVPSVRPDLLQVPPTRSTTWPA